MVTVAFAGATTGLGLTLLKSCLASKKHTIVLLTRTPNPSLSALGIDVRPVFYTDHVALVNALRGVHTIISTIAAMDDSMRTSQLALLAAAKEAGVKRFAPSEFAGMKDGELAYPELYKPNRPVWEAVKASGLEYTNFATGIFMNTFVTGTTRGEADGLEGLRPWRFVIDMKDGTADIPGDGNAKVTMTTMGDVGQFVTAALDLEEWGEEMGMVGETLTYNEALKNAEEVQGRKFLVKYKTIEEMEEMAKTEDRLIKFSNQVFVAIAKGHAVVPPTLNKLYPEVKPWTLKPWLEKWWGGLEYGEAAWGDGSFLADGATL